MAIKKLNPYLIFNGDAEKAIKLYEKVLGAKVESVQRFTDIPGPPPKPEYRNRIIHALLQLGEGVIMVSDAHDEEVPLEGNVHVSLDFDNVQDMTKKFEGLSQGGTVTSPLQDTFWGARFGMCTDPYGVRWMFNCKLPKK